MNLSRKPASQDPQARARDSQAKFIKDSVTKVEKSFSTICGQMGAVNRRNSRLRDKFDEMAKFLVDHSRTEQGPMKQALTTFAEHLSAVQDYRQALIDRMDGKVIQPLSAYKTSCKHTQTDLNKMMQSRGREMKTHRQLEQLRNKAPSDTRQITRAENELQRAQLDVERSSSNLEGTIDRFEAQRVADLKKILSDFVQIEMLFHAKALERLTLCYQDMQNFNLDDHIAIFRNTLRPSQVQQRLDLVQQQGGHNTSPQHQQPMGPQGQQGPGGDIYATPQKRQQLGSDEMTPATQDDDEYDDEEGEYSEEEEESEYEDEEEPESPEPTAQQQRLKPW